MQHESPGLADATVLYWDTTRPGYILDNVVLSDTPDGVGIASVPEPGSVVIWSVFAAVLPGLRLAKRCPHSAICR